MVSIQQFTSLMIQQFNAKGIPTGQFNIFSFLLNRLHRTQPLLLLPIIILPQHLPVTIFFPSNTFYDSYLF